MPKKLFFGLLVASVFLIYFLSSKISDQRPIVAITQIAPHPSLDTIRQGILDELSDQKQTVKIVYENAQGNIALASQIANKFVSLNPKVIVSITTPSTQTVYNVAHKYNIPVVSAGVSDPVSAKLISPGITGVSDFSPVEQQIELMISLQPKLKKLGILYNAAEANSVAVIEKLQALAFAQGIEVIKVTAANTQEVATAAASLLGKVDALYFPNDNTIATSLESVIKAVGDSLPIYASDPQSVERGCFAAVSYNQYDMGRKTGKILIKVLQGFLPKNIPVQMLERAEITLNKQIANKLKIDFPQTLLDKQPIIVGEKDKNFK